MTVITNNGGAGLAVYINVHLNDLTICWSRFQIQITAPHRGL